MCVMEKHSNETITAGGVGKAKSTSRSEVNPYLTALPPSADKTVQVCLNY